MTCRKSPGRHIKAPAGLFLLLPRRSLFLPFRSFADGCCQTAAKSNVTAISHSLSVLYEASKYPNLNVLALGGIFYSNTASYIDITSMDALSQLSIDTVFLGAAGITPENGLTNTICLEAEMKHIIVRRSRSAVSPSLYRFYLTHPQFGGKICSTICRCGGMADTRDLKTGGSVSPPSLNSPARSSVFNFQRPEQTGISLLFSLRPLHSHFLNMPLCWNR